LNQGSSVRVSPVPIQSNKQEVSLKVYTRCLQPITRCYPCHEPNMQERDKQTQKRKSNSFHARSSDSLPVATCSVVALSAMICDLCSMCEKQPAQRSSAQRKTVAATVNEVCMRSSCCLKPGFPPWCSLCNLCKGYVMHR
jgi:hypothetical protein